MGMMPSQVCVFDGDMVKSQINKLGIPAVPMLLARFSINQATAAYGHKLTLAHQRARDKVASVLLRLRLQSRQGVHMPAGVRAHLG